MSLSKRRFKLVRKKMQAETNHSLLKLLSIRRLAQNPTEDLKRVMRRKGFTIEICLGGQSGGVSGRAFALHTVNQG